MYPPELLPVMEKMKSAYKQWQDHLPFIRKNIRYTLAVTIDRYFIQTIENILIASFLQKQEKQPFVKKSIISLDVVKFFMYMVWEMGAMQTKQYISISELLVAAGGQLGGWNGQLQKYYSK